MNIQSYRIKNYRRLKGVCIDLSDDITIYVGSNNSGKTYATQAIYSFITGNKQNLSLYDFNSSCWEEFKKIENEYQSNAIHQETNFPNIELDLWLSVTKSDLHLVIPLLPSTDWEGSKVGIRISFTPKNPMTLLENYRKAKQQSDEYSNSSNESSKYKPWPSSIVEYLQRELNNEYELRYYVLDHKKFNDNLREIEEGYRPEEITGEPGGAATVRSLICVDSLSAHRHLSDPSLGQSNRSEEISKRMSHFYKRNLNQRQDDHKALKSLFDSEQAFNAHLEEVFQPTIKKLEQLGYPGVNNPRMKIVSDLDPARIMAHDAKVHYQVGDGDYAIDLPDSYNGLGFKNLIYMVVEILDSQARWENMENRPPLHLIFIEEPEAHLHAQLQQAFIRNILKLSTLEEDEDSIYKNQFVITTHSPHILFERGFKPIRYFRRNKTAYAQSTDVLNLSEFYKKQPTERDFLEKYLKLTHCDLFFSDAAILVEGNVERLLLPIMIKKTASKLSSNYLSILEIGGAFGHKFKTLINFLGLTTLIITDLDSVTGPENNEKKQGKSCLPTEAGAITSNQTLINWLPCKNEIKSLQEALDSDRVQHIEGGSKVMVTYQTSREVIWRGEKGNLCGRTFEEDFGLENADWSQDDSMKHLGLFINQKPDNISDLAKCLHEKISNNRFEKTKFALTLMAEDEKKWSVPKYIKDGLVWLQDAINNSPAQN